MVSFTSGNHSFLAFGKGKESYMYLTNGSGFATLKLETKLFNKAITHILLTWHDCLSHFNSLSGSQRRMIKGPPYRLSR